MSQKYSAKIRQQLRVETLEPLVLMSATAGGDLIEGTADNDVLVGTSVGQAIDGGDGRDLMLGMSSGHVLNGGAGDDSIFVTDGANTVDGGCGLDSVTFWGLNRDDAEVIRRPDGSIAIVSEHLSAEVVNVETFIFHREEFSIDDLNAVDEVRSADGSGNQLDDVAAGSTFQQLVRLSDVAYADGIDDPSGADRESARQISNVVAAQETTERNDQQLSDLVWVWGQFLDHDLSLTEPDSSNEAFDIEVPEGDPWFDPLATGEVTIGLNRSLFDDATGDSVDNPRQQVNEITSWIDGSMVYGSSSETAAELRSFDGGQLLMSDGDLLPIAPADDSGGHAAADQFLAGDIRANENVALTAMHTVWVREHNRIAADIAAADGSLSDERIYQEARQQVIAQIQHITWNEFLPALLSQDEFTEYSGYQSDVDPSIANEFSTAAFRFGHTMLSGDLLRLNADGSEATEGSIALRDAFFSPDEIREHGIDSVLMGATVQLANEIDTQVIDDVRNFLFGPPGAGGFDLVSLNIQRGRDHGLADYNSVRIDLGLEAVTGFGDITSDVELQQKLEAVYGDVNNVDLWVAGLAEDHQDGSSLGETFSAIIADQFTRLRDADRFWYEGILDGDELAEVQSTTLSDVIARNTNLNQLSDDVFRAGTVV
ncbi:MAG: peroxidase family protein [Fuerstiella sp.]